MEAHKRYGYGLFAIALHLGGMYAGLYPEPTEFQYLTHAVSGSALYLVLGAHMRRLAALLLTAIGAVLWEVAEFISVGVPGMVWFGIGDTTIDLVIGIGAAIAAVTASKLLSISGPNGTTWN